MACSSTIALCLPATLGANRSCPSVISTTNGNAPVGRRRRNRRPRRNVGVLPEPAVGAFNASRNPAGRFQRHYVIGCAGPCQNPSVVVFGSSQVRGRGLVQGRV